MLFPSPNQNPPHTRVLLSSLPKLKITTSPYEGPKFTLFPQLPAELRNNIWHHVSFLPQKINLNYNYSASREDLEELGFRGVEGSFSIPSILHTSSESRSEGLRYYQLVKHKVHEGDAPGGANGLVAVRDNIWIYVNFEVDHFLYNKVSSLGNEVDSDDYYPLSNENLAKIKFLDIQYNCKENVTFPFPAVGFLRVKRRPEKLEMVTLVVRRYTPTGGVGNDIRESVEC
jgi:hypothetical protein